MTRGPRTTAARRRLAPLGAVLAVGALLAACTGSATDERTDGDTTPLDAAATGEGATGTVTLYAAASLQAAFTDLIAEFETANPGITVEPPVYDGSSTLVTQLTEGADADVLATADEPTMDDLVTAGLAGGDPQLFASNTLVIAVADGNPLGIAGLADLADVSYVVCARDVPCGNATQRLLDAAGLPTDDAVSQEQNVSAVAERIASGEVDAGLVYATDVATRSGELDAIVPEGAPDVVNRYPIVTLTGADPAASVFVDHVLSDDGQAVLAEHGFGAP